MLRKQYGLVKQGGGMHRKKQRENSLKGISRGEFLKAIGAGVVLAGFGSFAETTFAEASDKSKSTLIAKAGTNEPQNLPTRENPLIIDEKGKRALIYTEVHEMNVNQGMALGGVGFKDAKFKDRAILRE